MDAATRDAATRDAATRDTATRAAEERTGRRTIGWVIVVGVAISLVLAGFVSFYASSSPDGLEKVAEEHGFIDQAQDSANASVPTADYGIAGIDNERLSAGLAGVLGVVVIALLAFGLFALITRGKKHNASTH